MFTKPPRLRTACTECHASKVRCNSEKTGCARCVQNNLNCVYKISMVGRTSKKRQAPDSSGGTELLHRRKSSGASADRDAGGRSRDDGVGVGAGVGDDTDLLCSPAASAVSDTLSALLPELVDSAVSPQFLTTGYSGSLTLHDIGAPTQPHQLDFSAGPAGDWSWGEPTTGAGGGSGSTLTFSEDSHHHRAGPTRGRAGATHTTHTTHAGGGGGPSHSVSSKAAPSTSASSSVLPSLPDHADGGAVDDDGRGRLTQLMSLCHKARKLEGQLQSRLGTLDEIMKMNKTCLTEIAEMTGARREGGGSGGSGGSGSNGGGSGNHLTVCRCSCAVIAACLDTMLSLFEEVLKASGLDNNHPHHRGGIGGSNSNSNININGEANTPRMLPPSMPSLHFGVFEVDPLEQAAITRRILARELQSYRNVVRMLATSFYGHSSNDTFRKLMGQWCLSLVTRVERLLPIALDVDFLDT